MTSGRAFSPLFCLLVFAFSAALARADSWRYASGGSAAPGGNGLSIGFHNSDPAAVDGPTSPPSSQFRSCTDCSLPAHNVFADHADLTETLNFRGASRFRSEPFDQLEPQASG